MSGTPSDYVIRSKQRPSEKQKNHGLLGLLMASGVFISGAQRLHHEFHLFQMSVGLPSGSPSSMALGAVETASGHPQVLLPGFSSPLGTGEVFHGCYCCWCYRQEDMMMLKTIWKNQSTGWCQSSYYEKTSTCRKVETVYHFLCSGFYVL